MGYELIFLTVVLGIAGMHLLFRLVNFLAGFKTSKGHKVVEGKEYDDWYVFFDKASLCGDAVQTTSEQEVVRNDGVNSDPADDDCPAQEAYA